MLGAVEKHHPQLLVGVVFHAHAQVAIGIVARCDLGPLLHLFYLVAACKLEGCLKLEGLDLAYAFVVSHQLLVAPSGNVVELAAIVVQDALAQVDHALARRATAHDDGKELGYR